MRRGQTEIIGLIVVVLLLVFALIFFVKVKSSPDTDDESRLIRYNLRANSALNALMKFHIKNDAERRQMKDVVQECVDKSDPNSNECVDASSILNQTIKDEVQFDEKEYWLAVMTGANGKMISSGAECKNSIPAVPFYLRNGGRVEFKVCA